jgi:predicted O-methyltransferase YrrM
MRPPVAAAGLDDRKEIETIMTLPEAAERYLAKSYNAVKGPSSKISAIVATRLLAAQTAHGVHGHVAEIGVFEGRFFIALALCVAPRERAIATDHFTWPDEGIADRFLANCRAAGVNMDIVAVQKEATHNLTRETYRQFVGGPLRFLHVDGAHGYDGVLHDLQLAKAALHPQGILCLDDVLHPRYPALTIAIADWLKANPDFTILAIVDRESFASACKFLVCRREHADFYRNALIAAAPEHVMNFRANYFGDEALIISPKAK